jgi:GMP synthase-like glutamine amidotransferase
MYILYIPVWNTMANRIVGWLMKILVVKHMDIETGGLLADILRAEKIEVSWWAAHRGDPLPNGAAFDLLLVMGGPQQVWETTEHPWLHPELELIRHWVTELRKPYFGVCLGHQLLCAALGGEVGIAQSHEIGFPVVDILPGAASHPLLAALPPANRWLQWHEAEVIEAPHMLDVMAQSQDCAVQILCAGTRVISTQFHLEGTADIVEQWTSDPETVDVMQQHYGKDSVARLRAEALRHLPEAQQGTEVLFRRWLALNTF